MGVYINMEMPNKKNGAVLIIYPNGDAVFEDGYHYKAIPVPPHGRLIDADALCDGLVSNHTVVIHAKSAPTIIPAEEGE